MEYLSEGVEKFPITSAQTTVLTTRQITASYHCNKFNCSYSDNSIVFKSLIIKHFDTNQMQNYNDLINTKLN